MSQLLSDLASADATSALGDLADSAADRTAIPIPLSAITRTIQVCGVNSSDNDVADLADNIGDTGLVHPVEVSPNGDGTYTLTKGNGRLLAHAKLGCETILAFVDSRPVTDATMAEFIRAQAAENAHRKQLTILETLNTIEHLAGPPCNSGRNAIGRIMKLPETTLKRYWRIYRTVRDRDPRWHPTVAAWLNTPLATWIQAAAFADDPAVQQRYADHGELPDSGSTVTVDRDRPDHDDLSAPPDDHSRVEQPARRPGQDDRGAAPAGQHERRHGPLDGSDTPGRTPRRATAGRGPTAVGGPIGPPTRVHRSPPPVVTRLPSTEPPTAISKMWDRLQSALQELESHRAHLPAPLRDEIRAALATAMAHLDA